MNAELPENKTMPNWDMLADYFSDICGINKKINPIEMAQLFEKRFGRVQLIENTRKALFYDVVLPGKAHRVFAEFPFDVIYTTNLDLLIEKSYLDMKHHFAQL
jgi:hypothetical protein